MSIESMKKRVPITTQNYLSRASIYESVHDLTIKIRQQKKEIATTEIGNTMFFSW